MDALNQQARQIIDYQKFGLFFSYDLLGYGLMALSTFFAGLTIELKTKYDKWLKWLLIIHGVFFISCFIMPMLGLFSTEMQGADWIGRTVLLFWCVYFAPVGILSLLHFKNKV
jgi:predicted Na+-dependent transporter